MVEGTTDLLDVVAQVGPQFAERAAEHDEQDKFVADNHAALKKHRFFSAQVPKELGGGGAAHQEMARALRELAKYCSSTALSASMHQHMVAAARSAGSEASGEGRERRACSREHRLQGLVGIEWDGGEGGRWFQSECIQNLRQWLAGGRYPRDQCTVRGAE